MTSPATNLKARVFISYARKDGEKFAHQLFKELDKHGLSPWLDRYGMSGNHDWWQQIQEALQQVEYLVLVATPEAMGSKVVEQEWRYARQQGVCFYAVLMPGLHPNFEKIPRWMSRDHFYDYANATQRQKLFNDLNTRCAVPRVPFMCDDLPESFVPRPDELDQIIDKLLDEKREEPVAITAALRGAGGFGKTTLARAICHDERVQQAFDDGIYVSPKTGE